MYDWDIRNSYQPPAVSLEQVGTKAWSQFRYQNFMALEHLLAGGCISHMPQIIALQRQNCAPLLRAAAQVWSPTINRCTFLVYGQL